MKELGIDRNDSIYVKRKKIVAIVKGKKYKFKPSQIYEVVLSVIPFDSMCIIINTVDNTRIMVLSLHSMYENLLYKDLKKIFPIDYSQVSLAENFYEKKIYLLYRKEMTT